LGVVVVICAWTIVQWFVTNLAMATGNTAHVPLTEKVAWGIRTAMFQEELDSEAFVCAVVGMLMIPYLAGIGLLGGVTVRRWARTKGQVTESFPCTRVLMANWIWMVYWPAWLLLSLWGGGVSLFMWIVTPLVIPPLLAFFVGGFIVMRHHAMIGSS
jgi:hypothetical protein